MGQTNAVPSKLYSSEFLLEFELYLTDSEAQLETEEHMKIIATKITKYLISKDPLPEPLFNIEFYTQRDRIHSLACKGKLVFKDFFDIVASCSTKLDAMKTLAPLRNCTASFLNFSSALGLPLVGFGFLGLSLLLQEDQTLKMKKYVDQIAKALKQKIDLERLKDALDDLRAKLLAIRDILCQIETENLEDSDKRALIWSLMVPLKEIYHKITMKNSIYQNFSAYTFETVIFFFILHLGVLKIAKNRFGLALDLEQRRAEYPKILETYLRLMSAQRQKLRHKNGSFVINSTMTSIQERVFKTGEDPEDSPIYGRVLKGLSVEDKLTGEVVFCLDCLKSPLARLKCYSLTFDLVYSKDLFYDAYKEKFQECLAWFEKANTESADILYEKLPIDIL